MKLSDKRAAQRDQQHLPALHSSAGAPAVDIGQQVGPSGDGQHSELACVQSIWLSVIEQLIQSCTYSLMHLWHSTVGAAGRWHGLQLFVVLFAWDRCLLQFPEQVPCIQGPKSSGT
jgi:hypothetical protein